MIYTLERIKHFLLCTIRISEKIETKIFSMKNKVVARENEKDLVKKLLQQYKTLKDYMKKIKRNKFEKKIRESRLFRRGDGNGWIHRKKLKKKNPKKEKKKYSKY